MSSPSKRDDDNDSSVFFTPLKNIHFFEPTSARQSPFVDASPGSASPRRRSARGIIQSGHTTSPFRPLSGRAGLRSPDKRDLEKSARKRSIKNSSFYRRLLDVGNSDDDDDDDREDRRFAEKILRISRGDTDRAYASDVDLEQDMTEAETRKKRKYTRRKTKDLPSTKVRDLKSSSRADAELLNGIGPAKDGLPSNVGAPTGLESLPKRKRGRPRKVSQSNGQGPSSGPSPARSLSPSTDNNASENGQDESTAESLQRLKRGRLHRYKKYADDSESSSDDDLPKRKRGRPSKREGVIGTIKSIFDEEAFEFEEQHERPEKKETHKPALKPESSQVSLFESTLLTVPIVSGIPGDNTNDEPEDPKTEFVSLPVPELTENGDLTAEYLVKYFGGKQLAPTNGRFLDERSFFLEGAEGYFEQNNLKARPSINSLAQMAPTLDHGEFSRYCELGSKICAASRTQLKENYALLHRQLCFELSQGFNVCFHGVGSKLDYILDFVEDYIPQWISSISHKPEKPIIMVINGFNPHLKLKDTLLELAAAVVRHRKLFKDIKIPRQVSETIPFIIQNLQRLGSEGLTGACNPRLILVIHNIDGEVLRDDKIQGLVSELCALPQVWLIASTDHVNATLLWDLDKSRRYNFAWHNITTLEPYRWELASKDMINMGRSKMFVGEKGAKYVLTSLPTNSRKIYRQLLENQIVGIQKAISSKANINGQRGTLKNGVELTRLYDKCMDGFLTSSELLFRTVLGEFIEHSMCKLAKDASGVEIVYVPFNYDEMQKLVKEDV